MKRYVSACLSVEYKDGRDWLWRRRAIARNRLNSVRLSRFWNYTQQLLHFYTAVIRPVWNYTLRHDT